ncbi:MAG: hypothetical protein PUP46_00525, partial [Endozoicomonas sp. (ex Botrylloides leachii)]|nr:hypothetical protein [Endozoicomonas sp. (ex Botrylloides leachii)]
MNSQPPGSGKSNNISSNNDPNKQLPVAPDNEEKSGSPVTRVNPEPMLPQGGSGMPGQVLRERNASIAGQQISQQMQQHLDEFSFNGSAHALLAMLNSQTGLNGQFEIVFQPNKGGDPIPFNKFTEHPAINQAYQKIAQKIAQNHQSIAYGLAEKMAMLQQQMAMVAMQQQQMQMANMAFMQALLNPVIQPMAVPLDYLLGFKGQQVPGFQHNPAMGWGGMPGGVAPQPTWANYPKFLQMPQPFEQANALPKGLCAIPQPQQGMGLQMPFSPWGWYAQNNPATGQGQDALLNQLQQFTNARPSSLVPPWAWGPPVIVNRIFPNSGKKQSSPEGVTVNPAAAAINPAGTAVTPAEISVNTGPVTVNTGEKTVNPAGAPKSQEVNNNDYSVILSHLKEIKGILSSISGNAFSDAQFAKLQYSIERLNNQFTQYLSLGRKDEAEITRLQQTTRYLSEQLENQQVKTLQGIAKILENQIKNLQNKFNTQNESNNHDINSKPKKALGSNKESNDLVEIKNKLDSLANQLKELTPDYSSDAQNDSKYKELFKSFMSYVRGAKEENLPHRKGHENKAEEAEALKEKINNIKEELHAIKRGKNNASNRDKENIAALEERLSELENKIALLEDYRNKIDKEKSDNKYDKLLEKLIELEDYVKKAETENADFKKGQLIVSTETEALKKQINDIKEELYDIKRNKDNGVNQAKENSLAIEQKIKSLADQISLLKKNKEKEDNEEDSSHYTQQLAKIEALQKDLERARAENSALRKGEENRSKEIETLKQEIKKAKEDFNAIRESSHSSESMSSIRSSLDNRSINSDKDLLKEGSEKSQNTERAFEHNESNLTNSEKISSGHVSSRTDNDTELNQDPSSTTSHSTKTELSSVATAIESYAKDLDDLYEDDLYEKVNNYYGILYSKIESNKNKVESVIKHADDFHEKLDEEELDKIVNHLKFIQSDLN